mgnify:CR=1 FL=1
MTQERKYWDPEIETMPLDKLKRLQENRLQSLVTHAYEKSALYRRKYDKAGINPKDIKTLDDLPKLPFLESVDEFLEPSLAENIAVSMEEVKEVTSTSGTTTGFSRPVLFTHSEADKYYDIEARARWMMGARPWDIVQVLTGFECCRMGYVTLGAMTFMLHCGRGILDNQIRLAQTVGVTVLEHIPSLVLQYFERAKELGFDIRDSKLRLVSGAGEAWAEARKKNVKEKYGIPFRTLYGNVEVGLFSAECGEGKGMHISADSFIVEIIDPETLQPLGLGQEGEMVVTCLNSEAMPLVRYRMGDMASILPYEPCPCGRTLPRMSAVKGRAGDLIKVRGKKFFPIDVEEVVASTSGLGDQYQVVLDKPGEQDKLKVRVEYRPEVENLPAVKHRFEEALNQELGVESEAELVSMGSIIRTGFKVKRVITTYNS